MTTSLVDSMTRSMTFICRAHRPRHLVRRRHDLGGLVGKRDCRTPNEPESPGVEIIAYRAISEDVERRHVDRHHLLAIVDQVVEAASRRVEVRRLPEDGLHGIGLRAVPVNVEDAGELANDGTHHEYVHVDEIARRAAREVFVGDIAPAHDSEHAIGDEQLVVHPVIEPPEIGDRRSVFADDALSRAAKWVEQAHLDVRERRQAAKHRVPAHGVEIVHQQTHSHAAQRGIAQVAHEQPASAIVLDQVVLDVEGVARPAGQLDPGIERVET